MKLKPTHQLRSGGHEDVVAWQFLPDNGVPVWVFRSFHMLGDGLLTHRSGVQVKHTDWIVRDPETPAAFVLSNEEFDLCFAKLL
jgi:hypothetical protein